MFSSQLAIVATKDSRNCVFVEPMDYTAKDGRQFRIPKGAETDGASTPRVIWREIPPFGEYWLAAALHDAAYRNTLLRLQGDGQWLQADLTKVECDSLLLEAMEAHGVPKVERDAIYEGVHLFGWKAFRDDRARVEVKA